MLNHGLPVLYQKVVYAVSVGDLYRQNQWVNVHYHLVSCMVLKDDRVGLRSYFNVHFCKCSVKRER